MTIQARFVFACVLLPLTMLAGCAGPSGGGPGDAATSGGPAFQDVELDPIRIGVVPGGDALPLWVAREHGLFADAGVDAELVVFESAGERDAALAGGAIDAFAGDLGSAVALEASGVPVALVATMTDPARSAGAAPGVPEEALHGLGADAVFLGVSDRYLAMPSGLLATRAVLEACNAAVVRIQADPAAHRALLIDAARLDAAPEQAAVAGGAYLAASAPGRDLIETLLEQADGEGVDPARPGYDDLVIDIVR